MASLLHDQVAGKAVGGLDNDDNDGNDALLTDSEITNLRLDADRRLNSKRWRVIWCSGRPNLGWRLQEKGGPFSVVRDLRLLSAIAFEICR